MREATSCCMRACCSRCSSGAGDPVRSRTAQGTEQIGPSDPGQESLGHGGLLAWESDEEPVAETSPAPVEASSPGPASEGVLSPCAG